MRVIALLPTELLGQLTSVLGDAHSVHAAFDPVDLHQSICTIDADLLIFDPMVCDGQYADAIEATLYRFPWLPIIVYTTVSARSMALVLRLAPYGLRHMVLYGIDDETLPFLELVERVPAYPVIDLILCELNNSLISLPLALRRAVELLFKSPLRARTSSDLAQLAGMTRGTLYRHMATAGLQPRLLIDCARLLRAYTLLRTPGSRLKETSAKLGFASPETLSELLREWTGHTMRSIHQGIEPELFVRLLANSLIRTRQKMEELAETCEATASSG
jgi:AraC-like DNA-binding protein